MSLAPAACTGYLEVHNDYEGSKIGMWFFLFTELLLFGALFLIYGVYRFQYLADFQKISHHLDAFLGTINTIVLLTSSLTMVLAITALQKNNVNKAKFQLLATIGCAVIFLIIKYFEWGAKFHHGIWPGSPELLKLPRGEILFYGLYFIMTGIHGLHVILGVGLLSLMFFWVQRGTIHSEDYILLENSGLYWHFVDLAWIYLFPLFYLVR